MAHPANSEMHSSCRYSEASGYLCQVSRRLFTQCTENFNIECGELDAHFPNRLIVMHRILNTYLGTGVSMGSPSGWCF